MIVSLNGLSLGEWIKYVKKLEEDGANGLQLDIIYYISMKI